MGCGQALPLREPHRVQSHPSEPDLRQGSCLCLQEVGNGQNRSSPDALCLRGHNPEVYIKSEWPKVESCIPERGLQDRVCPSQRAEPVSWTGPRWLQLLSQMGE